MSSICGIFYRDGRKVEGIEIDRMVDVLSHWKPDRTACWREGEAAFGNLALWTTPEAVLENCPFHDPESGVTVTADARVDNREELVHELGLSHRPLGEIGDTELIACAYRKWNEDCVSHLIGDFAFALWDPKARRLFCARDPMGLRPFYYLLDDKRFLFGTEIKALLVSADVPREENPLRFAKFVAGIATGEETQFRSIQMLRPAHTIAVEQTQMSKKRYWKLDPEREIHFNRSEDYVEAFEEVFQKAVDARLRSTGRVGSMLSGGLDATTMLSFALRSREISRDRLTAYTWALRPGDDWWNRDEREYVEAFLAENPIDHHYLVLESDRIFEENREIEHLQDGPIQDFQHSVLTDNFAHARGRNIRVVLFGDGGDETASLRADDYLLGLILNADWRRLQREVKAHAARVGVSEWQVWKSWIVRPLLRRDILVSPFLFQSRFREFLPELMAPEKFNLPLSSEVIRDTKLLEHYEQTRPRFKRAWRYPVRCNQIDLLTGTDVMAKISTSCNYSVLYGIECRFPFLDRRVVEYCVGVPPEEHRQADSRRLLLRRAAERRIPAKIAQRRDKSSTWPDILRGISQAANELQPKFRRWEAIPRIRHYLNVAQLQRTTDAIINLCQSRQLREGLRVGMFCRAVALGNFLENSERRSYCQDSRIDYNL